MKHKHRWQHFYYGEPQRISVGVNTKGYLLVYCVFCLKTKLIHPEDNNIKK